RLGDDRDRLRAMELAREKLAAPEARSIFRRGVTDTSPDVRAEAISGLGQLADPADEPLIVGRLNDFGALSDMIKKLYFDRVDEVAAACLSLIDTPTAQSSYADYLSKHP